MTLVSLPTEEVERLEKKVEMDDSRLRKLEEEKNLSAQESSYHRAKEEELLRQQRMSMERMSEMERELSTKDDLVSYLLCLLTRTADQRWSCQLPTVFVCLFVNTSCRPKVI